MPPRPVLEALAKTMSLKNEKAAPTATSGKDGLL